MQFTSVIIAAFIGLGAAATTCFDNGDCILAGGTCVKASGQITGTCSGTSTLTTTASASSAAATGSTCFDDGDCILTGGTCSKASGSITGNCVASS